MSDMLLVGVGVGYEGAGGPSNGLLLEDGASFLMLEDSTSFLLLEDSN